MENLGTPAPRLFAGNWTHLFGPGRAETLCRVVIDAANVELVASQSFDGLKWIDLSAPERADLADSLFDANTVSEAPEAFNLVAVDLLPDWAASTDAMTAAGAPENEYAFDCTLTAAVRVKAKSREKADAILRDVLNGADCNGGAWPNGAPVLFEASLNDSKPVLYELNGVPVNDTGKSGS
jgi:hypothetical protein